MASPAAALEKPADCQARPILPPQYCPHSPAVPFGGSVRSCGRAEARRRPRLVCGGCFPACAFSVGPRWEWQCSNPTRRPTPTCWRCRRGRSWLATTAFSACWVPAASASPISPTRRRWRGSSPSRNIFPPTTPPAAPPARPRRARRVAPRTTSGGSSASSRRRGRSRASFTPTSSASTGTSSPTTPATWSWSSRRAGASRRG